MIPLFLCKRKKATTIPTVMVALPLAATSLVMIGQDSCNDGTYEVPMRDGILLATDVSKVSRQAAPAILFRTPYDKDGLDDYTTLVLSEGYHMVSQDMRGFGDSGGEFLLFTDDGWGENQDGYDTLTWIESEDWSNGEVCMWGASALALASILAAGSTPPALKCAYVLAGSGDLYHHVGFWGGSRRDEMVVNWLTDLEQYESLQMISDHYLYDDSWYPVSIQERYESVDIPIYSMGGWYDIFSQGNIDLFVGLDTAGGAGAVGRQKLVMGPWSHSSAGPTVGELTYPENSLLPVGEDFRWFEHWLQDADNGVDTEPPISYYLMGDVDAPSQSWNIWKTTDVWPPAATLTPWYFTEEGGLSLSSPNSETSERTFTFDPGDPVPSVGGNNLYLPAGPYDQRSVESRSDVLIFNSETLESPATITGRVTANLWISSSAVDTDFTVKLTDVYPDGRSMLVLDGIARARFREGYTSEVMMTPGDTYQIEVDLWSTALVFNAGHQIRVAVSSSNSPRFHVNPNNGAHPYESDAAQVVAEQTLYLDASRPSHLVLPIIP